MPSIIYFSSLPHRLRLSVALVVRLFVPTLKNYSSSTETTLRQRLFYEPPIEPFFVLKEFSSRPHTWLLLFQKLAFCYRHCRPLLPRVDLQPPNFSFDAFFCFRHDDSPHKEGSPVSDVANHLHQIPRADAQGHGPRAGSRTNRRH
jgi:hypothetical protein